MLGTIIKSNTDTCYEVFVIWSEDNTQFVGRIAPSEDVGWSFSMEKDNIAVSIEVLDAICAFIKNKNEEEA